MSLSNEVPQFHLSLTLDQACSLVEALQSYIKDLNESVANPSVSEDFAWSLQQLDNLQGIRSSLESQGIPWELTP